MYFVFTTRTIKTFGILVCEGVSKQSPDPKKSTARPVLKIPGSATMLDLKATDFDHVMG